MAPEQILGTRRDPRSDIFALGVLMYFLSTGVRPFGDPQTLKGLKKRLWKAPVPPRKLHPDYPAWLQEIVLHCLEVDPAARYPTAAQVGLDLQNPAQVTLTARAERAAAPSFWQALKGKFNQNTIDRLQRTALMDQVSGAPIILVAIDLAEASDALSKALRINVNRLLSTAPHARVACINILKQSRLAIDRTLDKSGHNKHVSRLVSLKHWAEPLQLPPDKLTYHVLEAMDPAQALLDYARSNHVDHILMGARANSTQRKFLGSVSAAVASRAPCTVTVVRPRAPIDRGADTDTDTE
jgi:non-specific serine/threonine protein kinase/protein-serine/threonine kinase